MTSEPVDSGARVSEDEQAVPPVQLFQGYDTFSGAGRNSAVKGTSAPLGDSEIADTFVCISYSEVQTNLKISASASVTFGAGTGSVDAKAKFASSLEMTETTVVLLVYANHYSYTEAASSVHIIESPTIPGVPSPLELAETDQATFCTTYGDSYVKQLVRGAEYMAAYVFFAQSKTEQMSISGDLTAAKGRGDAELQASLSTIATQYEVRLLFVQQLIGVDSKYLPTQKNAIDFALNDFQELSFDDASSAVISYVVSGYETGVVGMPAEFASSGVVQNRKLFNGTSSSKGLSDQYARLCTVYNGISYLTTRYDPDPDVAAAHTGIYDVYGYTGDTKIPERARTVVSEMARLEALFDDMSSHPTQTFDVAPVQGLEWGSPGLNVRVHWTPMNGGDGTDFGEITGAGAVNNKFLLSALQLRGSDILYQIRYSFTTSGWYEHGGTDGNLSPEWAFSDQRVYEIVGKYGKYVYALEVLTLYPDGTKGIYQWPYSPTGDGVSTWTLPASSAFLGFYGQSGHKLDALGFVYATFGEAYWTLESSSASP